MSHANLPVFIPHRGCPNTCVFCDQRAIAGCAGGEEIPALLAMARQTIEAALATRPAGGDTEIAYFGGSFTGIDRAAMIALLELAQDYVRAGQVRAIRLSTRPDYVEEPVLEILADAGVDFVNTSVAAPPCRHPAGDIPLGRRWMPLHACGLTAFRWLAR